MWKKKLFEHVQEEEKLSGSMALMGCEISSCQALVTNTTDTKQGRYLFSILPSGKLL